MGNICGSTITPRSSNINNSISLNETSLDMYNVIQHIGSGVHGTIFFKKRDSNNFMVMKKVDSKRTITNEIQYKKLYIKNNNLIKYHDLILEGNKFYIVMDKYTDLLDYLSANGKITEKRQNNC